MRQTRLRFFFLIAGAALLAASPAPLCGAVTDSLISVLPAAECAGGWVMEEKPALFQPDTLFDHINGEAELYLPYGFEMLATARYVKQTASGAPLVADVYRMGSLLDAFGIYSNYRKSEAPECDVGTNCFLSSSQLLFYQDRYFVRLQATDTPTPGKDVFLACGGAISRGLPRAGTRPAELEFLNVPGIVQRTERYIAQSVLGYPFFRRGMTADARMGTERAQVFVVIEDSAATARKAFDLYRAALNTQVAASTHKDGTFLIATDPLYRGVYIEQADRYLIGAIRLQDPSAAKPVVEAIRGRIQKDRQ